MKLCRYDDDRLGVVIGDMVHDVTEAQTEIRAAAPYAMKGDAVIAALPAWRARLEEMAAKAPGKPVVAGQAAVAGGAAVEDRGGADQLQAHIEEMAARAATQNIVPSPAIEKAGIFLKSNSSLVGPSEGIPMRFPDRRNEHEVELVDHHRQAGQRHPARQGARLHRRLLLGLDMTARGQEDRSFRKSIDGYSVLGPWMVTADEIPDPDDVPLTISVNGEIKQSSNTSS